MARHGGDLYFAHPATPQGYALAYGFSRLAESEGLNLHHGFVPARQLPRLAMEARADAVWLPAPVLPFVQDSWQPTPFATWLPVPLEPLVATREPILETAITRASIGHCGDYGLGSLLAALRLPDARLERLDGESALAALADGVCDCVVLEPDEADNMRGCFELIALGRWWSAQAGFAQLPDRVLCLRSALPSETRRSMERCIRRAMELTVRQPEAAVAFAAAQAGGDPPLPAGVSQSLASDFSAWQSAWMQLWQAAADAGLLPHPGHADCGQSSG